MARRDARRPGLRSRWAVVLAGGAGRRLRSLTTDAGGRSVPKQYCALKGERSLLQSALARAERLVAAERIVVVVVGEHRRWWSRELAALPRQNVVVQPTDRGTAVGLLLSLLAIQRLDPEAEVVVLPADHWVSREEILAEGVERAFSELRRDPRRVVLLGVAALHPDPELGWIVPEAEGGEESARAVASFHEKPSLELARRLLEGGALANTFVSVGRLRAFVELLDRHSPLPCYLQPLFRGDRPSASDLAAAYRRLPRLDLSRDVLAKGAADLSVVAIGDCGWTDLGTPEAVRRCLLRERVPRLPPRLECRAPVDLSAPRTSVVPAVGVADDELAHYTEML